MKIFVLGGDGFCGWPTSLHLSNLGHQVTIIDNLSRRQIDVELGVESLTPIATIDQRIECWNRISENKIDFVNLDVATDFYEFADLIKNKKPDVVVHFAEQRAAPYSMKTPKTKNYTISNNICGTHNVLNAIVMSGLDIHLVHLGTMGVYGYGHEEPVPIPDGYLNVKIDTDDGREISESIVYPPNPGSIYHLTKTQDALMFQYYAKNDKLRITDLHQGIVWGTQTELTQKDEKLINRFDYDGDYGTVLNRFLMQAAVGHPLTVHGTGGQTRAFIHISDTCLCIEKAISNPPVSGTRPIIMNQMAESCRLVDLANMIKEKTNCEVSFVENPRNEAAENELNVLNDKLRSLGWSPVTLDESLMDEVRDIAQKYKGRCDMRNIPCVSQWNVSTLKKVA